MSELTPPETPTPDSVPSGAGAASNTPRAQDEAQFAQLFDVSPYPAVVTRLRDHTILAINQFTSEMFGVSQAEVIGQSVLAYYVDSAARERLANAVRRYGRADRHRLHVRRQNGEKFWLLASARAVTFAGEPAVLTVFNDITDQLAAEAALRASEQRLVTQSKVLTELTGRDAERRGDFDEELRGILRAVADTLVVERVSMWRVHDQRRAIRCVCMFLRTAKRFESGTVLRREDAPDYFAALERDRVIASENVLADPRTRELKDAYLAPTGIGAMLDIPLRQDDTMQGVLCCEHVGGSREWMMDEQNFALSSANLVVIAEIDAERRDAVARLAASGLR
jgi:PAS domain S-box-containing protein